ncbi:multiple sugar transport system ATP-binding protein [Variovorax boronicumulans]|uniref:Multiple sugar transport system ATP-binding protein n=1 Tax=Variovorax boronicumulans TaxID=436515 RepID=A0AAW8CQQ9_9BURK|nr:ABC transporter ATP-binding protein [Variovorax boronicumulans]MDP9893803.1 multiple sugar transport system ATP-binding protein [Variovorax boronicumulans]MDQ0053620.1 multiple sugar transport system ATP-binding protein [Variovorax boronicumulans]
MSHIQITGLSKKYGSTAVLRDVHLGIGEGEFVVLVGPSGCGKSTLLRAIAGLETTDGGSIAFDGEGADHLPPQQRRLAMVFQSYALYPHMTAHDNMAFGLREQRQSEALIAQRIAKASAALHLDDYLDRYPRQLSGGQRQRVAMGRAMVREPRAFLFDEPLSNLDAQLRVQMRAEIRALQRQLGTTTVYVTHDQEEAMTMADRIAVLRAGRIEQVGDPLTLYDEPANEFVARFIGSPPMNVVDARWAQGQLSLGEGIRLPAPPGSAGRHDDAVRLGIRPEHLVLQTGEASPDAPLLRLRVSAVDYLGSTTELHGTVPGAFDAGPWLARLAGRHRAAAGEEVTLTWNPSHAHLFNPESGARLSLATQAARPSHRHEH